MKLCIKNLNKTYGGKVPALQGVSLEIGQGMFGLLGPNGAGKSTLMRTLATLQLPDSGEVWFQGEDVLKHPQRIRPHLGYLPQEFGVYPNVSAWQLLDYVAVLKGIGPKKRRHEMVSALLQRTNLYEVRHRAVSSFSGGMARRWGIAQALLGDPRLIIVDEPTAGLDPEERVRFHNLLSDISQQVVVLFSTHLVNDVAGLCSNMGILHQGRLLLTGNPKTLMKTLHHRVWQRSIAKENLTHYRERFALLSTNLVLGETHLRIFSDQDPGAGFEVSQVSLEDVYFAAIAGYLKGEVAA